MPSSPARHAPTSIRLSAETRARLADVARQQRQSQSRIAEIAIQRYIESIDQAPRQPTMEEKLAYLRDLANAWPAGGGRSAEDIDASIHEMRSDRF